MPLIRRPIHSEDHFSNWMTDTGRGHDMIFVENVETSSPEYSTPRFLLPQFEKWIGAKKEVPVKLMVFPRGIHIQGHTEIRPSPIERETHVFLPKEELYGNQYQRIFLPKDRDINPLELSQQKVTKSIRVIHSMKAESREKRRFFNGLQSSIFHGKWLCTTFLETMDGDGLIGIRNPLFDIPPEVLAVPTLPGWELERMKAAEKDLITLLSLEGKNKKRDPKHLLEIIAKFGDIYLLEPEHIHLQFLSLCGVAESLADWIKCTEEQWKYPIIGNPRDLKEDDPNKKERVIWNDFNLVKKIEFICERFDFDPLSEEDTRPGVSLRSLYYLRNQIAHKYGVLPTLRDEIIFNWLRWVLDISLKSTVERVLQEYDINPDEMCIYREDFDMGIINSPGMNFRFDMSGR